MEGKFYPSVTKILQATVPQERQDALKKWRDSIGEKEAQEIRQKAMSRGDGYDKQVKDYYELGRPLENKALEYHLKQYKCHSLEKSVISEKHKYYGRYDIVFDVNGFLILNDFKGSSKPKKEEWLGDYVLQISAYVKALIENGVDIKYGMITVILENDVQKFVFSMQQIEYFFQKFLKRLEIYNNLNTDKNGV